MALLVLEGLHRAKKFGFVFLGVINNKALPTQQQSMSSGSSSPSSHSHSGSSSAGSRASQLPASQQPLKSSTPVVLEDPPAAPTASHRWT